MSAYVAVCNTTNFNDYYFRIFKLPQTNEAGESYANNAEQASWYFLNRLDFQACLDSCIPHESFSNVKAIDEMGNKTITSF